MTLAAGTRIGHYEIRSQLGAGGMGEVYLAHDTRLNRKVAIKLLPADSQLDKQANQRLLREAKAAANLDHPNICSIYEVSDEDGRSFICMQFVEGETLEARMKRKPLDTMESIAIVTQMVDALVEAHSRGTIHRDIKPSNIMITPRGTVKVMDFGLAKLLHSTGIASEAETEALISTPGAIMGTLPYMSPEQVQAEALDERSDIFSLGIVLYEMLSGQQPFSCQSSAATASAILTREPLPVARFAPSIPTELERIVGKTLRKDPDQRYQTAKDLLVDVKSLRDELKFQNRLERSTPDDVAVDQSRADRSVVTTETRIAPTLVSNAPGTVEGKEVTSTEPVRGKRSRTGLIVVLTILVLAFAIWFARRTFNTRWAQRQVPQVEELAKEGKYFEAYDLATQVQQYLTDDPTITRLSPAIADTLSVTTDPAGAQVYLKRFAPDSSGKFPPRQLVGETPLNNLRIARGQYVLYLEKTGFVSSEFTISGVALHSGSATVIPPPIVVGQKLLASGTVPDRMTFVPGGDYRLVAWARPTDEKVHLDDYLIDKYEVSNQDFKDFINAGGYLKKQYWKYPFIKDGKELSWEEAISEFKDHTGLPGPRNWSSQNFPEGRGNFPVTDISWYEAAAYAAFRGKQLPTVFQWEKAARDGRVGALTNYMPWGAFYPGDTLEHRANFRNDGPLSVDSNEFGMSPFGVYNMAGNVSEWVLNNTSLGFIASGGAWGEPTYSFAQYGTFPGFYSANKRGFRCAQTFANANGDQGAKRIEIKEEIPVYTRSSDEDFKSWSKVYEYEKKPLDPQVEKHETPEWIRERITFNGADGQRAIAYLYLPQNFPRPLQVIHFVPPGDVEAGQRPVPQAIEDMLGPEIKSGRAVFVVVIKGYIERLRPEGYVEPDPTKAEYRDKIVNWITDLRRGLDYLETRNDIDAKKISFYGPSAGAKVGLILAAVENRYASVTLVGAGIRKPSLDWIDEANIVKFSSHIRGPKLMLHGRYDENLSWKTQGEPLFKLLPEPKRFLLYEGGHVPPDEYRIPVLKSWLDETLGPVRRD